MKKILLTSAWIMLGVTVVNAQSVMNELRSMAGHTDSVAMPDIPAVSSPAIPAENQSDQCVGDICVGDTVLHKNSYPFPPDRYVATVKMLFANGQARVAPEGLYSSVYVYVKNLSK